MNSEFEKWKEREGFSDIMEGYTASFKDCWEAARAAGMREAAGIAREHVFGEYADGTPAYAGEVADAILTAIPTTQDNKEG